MDWDFIFLVMTYVLIVGMSVVGVCLDQIQRRRKRDDVEAKNKE